MYSTSCPSRRDSPLAASLAMPTSLGWESGSRGRLATEDIRFIFAYIKLPEMGDASAKLMAFGLRSKA